jgi:hypothetical protein
VLLQFGEKNPGMTRVMVGDALVFEHERLTARMNQFFDRVESQLRQCLRLARRGRRLEHADGGRAGAGLGADGAGVGRLQRYARSGFAPAHRAPGPGAAAPDAPEVAVALESRSPARACACCPSAPPGCPTRHTLLVADAHIGKAVAFRRLGVPVPRRHHGATLQRLSEAGAHRRPPRGLPGRPAARARGRAAGHAGRRGGLARSRMPGSS